MMLQQFRKFGCYGIFVGSVLIALLNTNIDTMPDFDEISENVETDENISANLFPISDEMKPAFNKKIVGLFDDMARFGYI